ncbi:MAG: peptide chain release factor N(5)-glutamine methyltransferase [Eubacteriaceae bacterium]|nr:peptide chain release factor N(5)-glutamine methyltransferase [Eubacteriaceae bacterium]
MAHTTLDEALAWASSQMQDNPSAKLDAMLLLCKATGFSREFVIAHGAQTIDDVEEKTFAADIKRRAAGFPLAYITKKKEFFGISFYVDERVLTPRPETELLVQRAYEAAVDIKNPKILDLCCGSGCVGLTLAMLIKDADVTLADISAEAAKVAILNKSMLVGERSNVSVATSDLFSAFEGELFDVVASNPPYIPSRDISGLAAEVRSEPMLALDGGVDGLSLIRKIIEEAPKHLKPKGTLAVEIGAGQAKQTMELMSNAGFKQVSAIEDYSGIERIASGVLV